MAGQHFCPDNSGYAEKRVQSYDFFSYLANFQWVSSLFSRRFSILLAKKLFEKRKLPNFHSNLATF